MAGYTRQSVADIINGLDITAPPLNAEFNTLASAFDALNGHSHSGQPGEGPRINLANAVTGYLSAINGGTGGRNRVDAITIPNGASDASQGYTPGSLWLNTLTGRVYVCVASPIGAAVWRELAQIGADSVFFPDTNNTVDIGTALNRFKNLWLAGHLVTATAGISGTLQVTGTSAFTGRITATGGVTGALTGNVTGNVTSTGSSTFGNVTVNGTLNVTDTTIDNVTTPTMGHQAANKTYVDNAIANLLNSAPGTLDTLGELAAALGNDPNFATTLTNSIAEKLPLAGGTMTGSVHMSGQRITGLPNPGSDNDAVRRIYVTNLFGSTESAATSATAAQAWAETPENSPVLPGQFSSLHHARKAAASAASVLASETNAGASASAAGTSASNAASSASNAATSETNAAGSATSAAASRDSAAGSATTAQSGANTATGQAIASAASAAASLTSANASNTARAGAESARDMTLTAFETFDQRYLGAFAVAPTTGRNNGPLLAGSLFYDTVVNGMRVYTGDIWAAAYVNSGAYLAIASNLSDLNNAGTARANLGLTSAATTAITTSQTDTTAGRITRVGDFGIGAVAPTIGDASVTTNTIAPGLYAYNGPNGSTGGPVGISWATLLHTRRASGGGESQTLFTDDNGGQIYFRVRGTGSWTSWVLMLSDTTSLNASNIGSGTLNDARLPNTVVKLTGNQTITGQKTYSNGTTRVAEFQGANITTNTGAVEVTYNATVTGQGNNRTIFANQGFHNLIRGTYTQVDGELRLTNPGTTTGTAVRADRTLTGGTGINTIGNLTSDRTISISDIVARRDAANDFTGNLTAPDISVQNSNTTHYWMREADGAPRALIFKQASSDLLRFRSYTAAGGWREASLDATTGVFTAPSFSGNVSASDLNSGTVPDARLSGSYGGLTHVTAATFRGNASDTVTSPAHTWGTDTDIGMYRVSSSEIGFTVGGVKRGGVNASGFVGSGSQLTGVAKDGVTLTGGNGMVTSIGNLSASRTITLATPSAITATSLNEATANSHTHSIGEITIRTLIAEGSAGQVGTYAFLTFIGQNSRVPGQLVAGSTLRYSGVTVENSTPRLPGGNAPLGTWMVMGLTSSSVATGIGSATLCMRVS